VAVACLGLWPVGRWPTLGAALCLLVSLAAGLALLLLASSTLPAINLVLFPLTSLAGAASVIVSVRPRLDVT
jgi:hypothetical protein